MSPRPKRPSELDRILAKQEAERRSAGGKHYPVTIAVLGPQDHGCGPWLVTMKLAEVNGRLECASITLSVDDFPQHVVNASTSRDLPFGLLLDMVRATNSLPGTYTEDEGERERRRRAVHRAWERARSKHRGGRPPEYGAEHFLAVAECYREAFERGNPTQAVAAKWQVQTSTAAKWVSRARNEFGLLAPTTRGKAAGAATSHRKTKGSTKSAKRKGRRK